MYILRKMGHLEEKWWEKHPRLNPHKQLDVKSDLVTNGDGDDSDTVCLIYKESMPQKRIDWFVNSGLRNHMNYDESLFLSNTFISKSTSDSVEIGNGNTVDIIE